MYSTLLKLNEWKNLFPQYKNKAYFKEKVYSLLYFQLISKNCIKHSKKPYIITVCNENYLDINKVLKYLKYLLIANNYNIILSMGFSNSNINIKFADYVAAARRKLENKYLKNLNHFKRYHLKKLDDKYIKKIFEK